MQAHILPMPMMNILNGGAHAGNGLGYSGIMILPIGAESFSGALRMGAEVYHALAALLKKKGLSTAVGDEGGFAPEDCGRTQALDLILEAHSRAGYAPGTDFALALVPPPANGGMETAILCPKAGAHSPRMS